MGCFNLPHERKAKYRQSSPFYYPHVFPAETQQGSYYPSPSASCSASPRDFRLDVPTSKSFPLHSASFKLTPSKTLPNGSSMRKHPDSLQEHKHFTECGAVGQCSSFSYGDERFTLTHSSPLASFIVEREQCGAGANLFPLPLPPSASETSSTSLNTCSDDASSHSVSSTGSGSSLPVMGKSSGNSPGLSSTADSQPVERWHPSPWPLPPPPQNSTKLQEFSYEELAGACLNFASEFFIREGGAGPVFRAVIKHALEGCSIDIAVTRLTQGRLYSFKKWKFEVASLARLSHRHLCKVIGFSGEDPSGLLNTVLRERLLVYEHSANGSLESLLYSRKGKAPLDWGTRLKIAMGAAQGLAYLHDRIPRQVFYRSFKTINIQVDANFDANLSDYGFARSSGEHVVSSPAPSLPTFDAYTAPETRSLDELSVKSNVWSFGIVLLELLTGRQNMDDYFPAEERNLQHWCRPYLLDSKRLYLIMDPELKGRYPTRTAKMVADVALQCLAEDPIARPSMRDVAAALCAMVGANAGDGKADRAPATAHETIVNSMKRIDSSSEANGTTASLVSGSTHSSNYGSKFKISKSHSLVSVLASPARVFVRGSDARDSVEAHGRSQRVTLRGFLSGEMSKEACGSWARDRPVLSKSYGFLSGEIGMQSKRRELLRSPSSQDSYLPPPLDRSISSSSRLTPISS